MHRQGQGQRALRVRVKASIVTNNQPAAAASSCCTPGRCPITLTTVLTCWGGHRPHRLCDRARLCRQGLPRPRRAKSPPHLHVGPEARRLRCHQARAAAPLRHRAHHRPPEGRRSPRPPLSQRPRRRRRQRRPLRRRPQFPPHPRLVQRTRVPVPIQAVARPRLPSPAQSGFLTGDRISTKPNSIGRSLLLSDFLDPSETQDFKIELVVSSSHDIVQPRPHRAW